VSGGITRTRLVLATRNPGKIREIAAVYAHLALEVRSLAGHPEIGELPEAEATHAENAATKARTVANATGLAALADDSGIEIDALGGAPGVQSRRFLGSAATDGERNDRILSLLRDVPDVRRTARYRAAIAVALPDGPIRVFEGACEGRIAWLPRGAGGFGYDSIFVPAGDTRTMAELPADAKNRISHRARALRAAEPYLVEILSLAGEDQPAGGAK
jgi:XTP/dITP diphosphohydrolase